MRKRNEDVAARAILNALKGFLDPFAKWITMKDQVCSCTVGDNLSPQVLGVHKPEELRKLLLFLG